MGRTGSGRPPGRGLRLQSRRSAECRFRTRSFDVSVERSIRHSEGSGAMRFMVLVMGGEEYEAGQMPKEEELREMGKFNEELVKAGVMLAGEGLHPSSKGARVR